MEINLHSLRPATGATKKKKRIGRGNASGHGSYSTRGQKGQRARSGGAGGLKRKGLVQMLKSKPKIGGFKSLRPKLITVNIKDLDRVFAAGETADAKKMIARNLIKTGRPAIKVLGDGRLTKKLTVIADRFSASAREAIVKAGGEARLISSQPTPSQRG